MVGAQRHVQVCLHFREFPLATLVMSSVFNSIGIFPSNFTSYIAGLRTANLSMDLHNSM